MCLIQIYVADLREPRERIPKIVGLVGQVLAFDNSGAEPRLVFEMRSAIVLTRAAELPTWAAKRLGDGA